MAPGAVLTAALAALAGLVWGRQAAVAAGTFGLIALAIQLGAGRLMRGQHGAPLQQFLARWGAGMGLRLLGVILLAAAGFAAPHWFPPLPAAMGFLGVLIPLLALELRRVP